MLKFICPLYLLLFAFNCYGQEWVEVETPLTYVTDIDIHKERLVIVGNLGAQMYYATSVDNGLSWDTVNITGVADVPGTPMYIGFFNELEGSIGIKGNFEQDYLQTTDGGLTWTQAMIELDTSCNNFIQPHDFYRINDQMGLVNGFQSGRYMVKRGAGNIWGCSSDFGSSWVPQMYVKEDSVWYTKDLRGFYVTRDAGYNWEKVIEKEFIHFQCEGDEIIALSTYYSEPNNIPVLYRTEDEWVTYDSIPLNEFNDKYLTLFVRPNSGGLYVIEAKDIYFSENGENNFQYMQTLEQEPFRTTYVDDTWYLSGRGLTRLNDPVSSTNPPTDYQPILVFPNPAQDHLEVQLPKDIAYAAFSLYTIQGAPVMHTALGDTNSIDISNLPAGVYIYNIRSSDNELSTGKLTVIR